MILACLLPVSAQNYRPAAAMLEDRGARQIGLGMASTALLDDVSSLYANPAGLAFIDNQEVMLDLGTTQSRDLWLSAATAFPIQRKATGAIGIEGFHTDREPNITRLGNDGLYHGNIPGIDENSTILHLGVGRLIKPDISIGIAGRYIRYENLTRGIVSDRYSGLYGTFGIRYNSAINGLVFGAAIDDFGVRLGAATAPDVPLSGSIGISYGALQSRARYLTVSADLVKIESQNLAVRCGAEYWWANFLGIRAGYDGAAYRRGTNPYAAPWRGGVSVNFHGILLDVTAVPNPAALSQSQIAASVRLSFGRERRR